MRAATRSSALETHLPTLTKLLYVYLICHIARVRGYLGHFATLPTYEAVDQVTQVLQGLTSPDNLTKLYLSYSKPQQPAITEFIMTDPRIELPEPDVSEEQIAQYEEQKKTWGALAKDPRLPKKGTDVIHKPTKRRETRVSKKASKLLPGQTNILSFFGGSSSSSSSDPNITTKPTTPQT